MKKTDIQKNLFDFVEEVAVTSVIVILILTFVFKIVSVSGTSMLPNFVENDKLIITSFHSELEKGDVVVVVEALDDPIIKRVIATQGQEVDMDYETGTVFVDGVAINEEEFGIENGITTQPYGSENDVTKFPQVVPKDCVFVLGDNRPVSQDSRYSSVGMVDKRKVLGEVIFRVSPFNKFGIIN